MKRELFQNVTALPYTSGDVIDREGYLSAIISANINVGGTVNIKVEHSDDGETFVPVTDKLVFPEKQTTGGEITIKNGTATGDEELDASAGGVINIDVDLAGLKNFVKFTITGNDGGVAVVLGDSSKQPV